MSLARSVDVIFFRCRVDPNSGLRDKIFTMDFMEEIKIMRLVRKQSLAMEASAQPSSSAGVRGTDTGFPNVDDTFFIHAQRSGLLSTAELLSTGSSSASSSSSTTRARDPAIFSAEPLLLAAYLRSRGFSVQVVQHDFAYLQSFGRLPCAVFGWQVLDLAEIWTRCILHDPSIADTEEGAEDRALALRLLPALESCLFRHFHLDGYTDAVEGEQQTPEGFLRTAKLQCYRFNLLDPGRGYLSCSLRSRAREIGDEEAAKVLIPQSDIAQLLRHAAGVLSPTKQPEGRESQRYNYPLVHLVFSVYFGLNEFLRQALSPTLRAANMMQSVFDLADQQRTSVELPPKEKSNAKKALLKLLRPAMLLDTSAEEAASTEDTDNGAAANPSARNKTVALTPEERKKQQWNLLFIAAATAMVVTIGMQRR
ncbi:unnamed protein product [Amoebophrya sp. A120]|nr:unnamed protein product [Amoebophrya sp. A120]|eukprot:GSA120T00001566001.1